MVNCDEILDCISKANGPISIRDLADKLDMPWSETTRKNLDKKVQSLYRFQIVVKIIDGKHVKIKITEDRGADNQ